VTTADNAAQLPRAAREDLLTLVLIALILGRLGYQRYRQEESNSVAVPMLG